MKKRILSVTLALCLSLSSQSVAYAGQEGSAQPEEGFVENSTEGSTENAGTDEDVDTASTEAPTQPEKDSIEDSTEESTEDVETSEEADTASSETAEPPETTEDGENGEETETAEQTKDPSVEELETSEDMDTESQEIKLLSEDIPVERSIARPDLPDVDVSSLTPAKVYEAMIALKDMDGYREGDPWTNTEPYSGTGDDVYRWEGGISISAVGCVAFAFTLSDVAFGSLPARMYASGEFTYEDIKVGDILRVNNDAHTVIVLEVSDVGVVVAEGNISTGDHQGKVHWGRTLTKEEVMSSASHYITRYPENYQPNDPDADNILDEGTLDGGLTWKLTNAGTLTISGSGPMPDFSSAEGQSWKQYSDKIRKVVIGDGVTSIGACAFWECGVLSAEISSSVTAIGNSAFRKSSIISVTIPSSVKTIGDSAFRECQGLGSVTVSDGLETIYQNAFNGCTSLKSISLPASIEEVGAAAFFQCKEMTSATFAPGSIQVKMGEDMFARCWNLMSVKLPSKIDCISERMFQNCLMLPGVEIPQGAESIGGSAFASCSQMTTVIIPDSVTTIGTAAFSPCPLTDIYFTGTEEQWNSIGKSSDTISVVSQATMHYNYVPATEPDEGDNDDTNSGDNDDSNNGNDNNTGDNNGDSNTGDNNGDSNTGDNTGDNNTGDNNGDNGSTGNDHDGDRPGNNSSEGDSDESTPKAAAWKPTTPDEIKRYDCMGKEEVRYTLSEDTVYPVDVENAMQGPMCFQVFELVLGDYTIGRTYNIYAGSDTAYSTDQEVQITLEIPSALYKEGREYKMICVTEGGQPVVYDDLDSDPGTITIKTNKFYAYALIYK